jgi:hypothetical protein
MLMKHYIMYMLYDTRSPIPHVVGPPGCGKSTAFEHLAELLGVNLHILNVSRINPLELEGLQMPHQSGEELLLKMLPATWWTQLRERDVVLLDEFLRGFPEVYNALIDVLTSRRVGNMVLPKVFIAAASNSVTTYDTALEDRLLHLPVPDPRNSRPVRLDIAATITEALGLLPKMTSSVEMESLLQAHVLPMYELLDVFKRGAMTGGTSIKGFSPRKLIGQAQLREIQVHELEVLIDMNNRLAMQDGKPQFVLLRDGGASVPTGYSNAANKLPVDKLTDIQQKNLTANLQLMELEAAKTVRSTPDDDIDADIFA